MTGLNDFHYAQFLLEELYGIKLPDEKFEEIGLIAYQRIGNKRMKIYRYTVHMDDCVNYIDLPCNCDQIEAVTTGFEDWNYSTNDTPNGDINSAFVEQYIEYRKKNMDKLYIPGKFIKYELVGDRLYFKEHWPVINILYRGEELDDDGLPRISDKEAVAMATFCAYITKYKEGLKTMNAAIIQMAESLNAKWLLQCDQARIMHLTQNDFDEILDAKTCWGRKQYRKSFKINQ